MKQNLGKMKRGDTKTVQFTVAGATLPPAGLAGFAMWFTAKAQVSYSDAAANIRKTGTDFSVRVAGDGSADPPVDGLVQCVIQPADTNSLPDEDVVLAWDFQLKDPSGAITTSAEGTLTVTPDITRAE